MLPALWVLIRRDGSAAFHHAGCVVTAVCGISQVLAHNPEAAGAASLLGGDSDHYYMTPCTTPKKWVVISLSEDVSERSWWIAGEPCVRAKASVHSCMLATGCC